MTSKSTPASARKRVTAPAADVLDGGEVAMTRPPRGFEDRPPRLRRAAR
jgi:hypothetical protein